MTEPAVGSLTGNLRVAIAARGEERIATLTKLLRLHWAMRWSLPTRTRTSCSLINTDRRRARIPQWF